jgi:hypothetical protein
MKIIRLKLRDLRNDEFFQFFTRFRDMVREATSAALRIETLYASFLTLYGQMDEALKKIMKSEHTARIAAADHERDTVFRGMANAVKSAGGHFDAAKRAAAGRLKIVFDTYGNLAAKADDEETSAIGNLLRELLTNHAADCEALGLTEWITELDRLNRAVEALMRERFDEVTERTDLVMRDIRLQIGEVWYSLADRIDALHIVEGDTACAPWTSLIADLNAVIERTENIVAQRKGRAKAEKEEEAAAEAAGAGADTTE